jgi:25S rRNA (uracil2634-N3)-methyltransferase
MGRKEKQVRAIIEHQKKLLQVQRLAKVAAAAGVFAPDLTCHLLQKKEQDKAARKKAKVAKGLNKRRELARQAVLTQSIKLPPKIAAKLFAVPFKSTDVVLLVGEGNFTFARALTILTHTHRLAASRIVATSLDSRAELLAKYAECEGILSLLERRGVTVLHGVDARTLHEHKKLRTIQFNKIVFNFPHEGRGISDEAGLCCSSRVGGGCCDV